jgi:hypothetical protein
MANPNDEATTRALVGDWLNAGWVEEDEAPFIAQDITAALAASRAEGEGQVAALREALKEAVGMAAALVYIDTEGMADPDALRRTAHEELPRIKTVLTDTAAAAQAHDAKVRAPLEAKCRTLTLVLDDILGATFAEQEPTVTIADIARRVTAAFKADADLGPAYTAAVAREARREERERCARLVEMQPIAEDSMDEMRAAKAMARVIARGIRALRDDGPEDA